MNKDLRVLNVLVFSFSVMMIASSANALVDVGASLHDAICTSHR